MPFTNVATIIHWDNKKGYGFAAANGIRYFVRISAFGPVIRQPLVGDIVIVEKFGKSMKGPKIEKGILEGVSFTPQKNSAQSRRPLNLNPKIRNILIALCAMAAAIAVISSIAGNAPQQSPRPQASAAAQINEAQNQPQQINPDGAYTTKMDVARYICQYGHLPRNYVDKYTARRMYEEKTGRNFTKWNFNPLTTIGLMVGGDTFENREHRLPEGHWNEADVDYFGQNRGTKRLVYDGSCNIYYTGNHYISFSKIEF